MKSALEWYETIHWGLYQQLQNYRKRLRNLRAKTRVPGKVPTKRTLTAIENNRQWIERIKRRIISHEDEWPQFYNYGTSNPDYTLERRRLKLLWIAMKSKKGTYEDRLKQALEVCENQLQRKSVKAHYRDLAENILKSKS